ncbi:MAG: hypothetical protein ERJ67_02515 [Aphanocapsa feldmannii 277cV]|uniref:Uncharacterized protein n=2 Tax=Aphanocapsa feldmannii TaxID=192050 RepID=A0A524RQ02_9CHRO|nr:MAG: hypothetical protein ERJ67_02515 [Aphanocapsa feldmannii 277cV]TGH20046.1 MAG: hypothetical protein ERJ68_07450 [Aphanocapsa feldmannii 277cI]
MGLFDRFRAKPGESKDPGKEAFFLDADASGSLGDVAYMRRSNTIRHTFPANADSPTNKELIKDVASMDAKVTNVSAGLPEARPDAPPAPAGSGVPKPVRKTFPSAIDPREMARRLKRADLGGTNSWGKVDAAKPVARKDVAAERKAEEAAQVKPRQAPSSKSGSIDPFRSMLRDLDL